MWQTSDKVDAEIIQVALGSCRKFTDHLPEGMHTTGLRPKECKVSARIKMTNLGAGSDWYNSSGRLHIQDSNDMTVDIQCKCGRCFKVTRDYDGYTVKEYVHPLDPNQDKPIDKEYFTKIYRMSDIAALERRVKDDT